MDVHERLARAWAEVEKSGVPEQVQGLAFKEALARIDSSAHASSSTARVKDENNTKTTPPPADDDQVTADDEKSPDELMATFALETGIDASELERLVHFKDGKPGISVTGRLLGSTKSEQTKAVCLIITAAYDYALGRADVDASVVREACSSLRCLDPPNFSRHITSAPGVNATGPGGKKVLKRRPDTISKLTALVERVAG